MRSAYRIISEQSHHNVLLESVVLVGHDDVIIINNFIMIKVAFVLIMNTLVRA